MVEPVASPTVAALPNHSALDEAELFETAAADFTRRIRAGERPTIDDYAARYPQIAELIRELLPTIAAVEHAKTVSGNGTTGRSRAVLSQRPERLGDFRIVREIGSGGMGVVYEAVQESLARNVAVKVLPPQVLLDERRVRRFEQEAKLAAQLHHTNIVPVFGVGSDEGLHYYVMQLIDGEGLDRRLAKPNGALPPHEAALLARDVARALQCAHEQGTLHRDVKPANILLDRTGHVWITDFGLAQALEADDVSTQAHVAGTLRYMPPERFHGVSDARGDVYSLGVTLFEAVCGRSPFTGESNVELMRQITNERLPSARSVNPQVPRDLETLIAKATAREPQNRYASAAELVEDLSRFIDGVPIRARRISQFERARRWCLRNRLTAAALGVAVVSMLSLTIVSAWGYWETKKLNAELARSFTGEQAARASAEATSTTALEALDRIFDRLAPSRALAPSFAGAGTDDVEGAVPAIPAVSPEIASALEEVLPYYAKLAADGGDDPLVRRRTASALHRIGLIQARLGRAVEATRAWRQADELVTKLVVEETDSTKSEELLVFAAGMSADLGDAELFQDHRSAAAESYRLTLARLQKIPAERQTFEVRRETARAHLALGSRNGRGAPPTSPPPPGGPGEPRAAGGPRGDDLPPFFPPHPPRPGMGPGMGPGHGPPPRGPGSFGPPPGGPPHEAFGLGPPPGRRPPPGREPPPGGPPHDADDPQRDEHLSAAFALLTSLRTERPDDAETRLLMVRCYRQRAKNGPPGRREWESTDFVAATTLLREMVQESPEVPDFAAELCETLVDFHVHDLQSDDWPAAAKQLREALTISEALTRDHAQTAVYAISQVHIHNRLASVEKQLGNREAEEQSLRHAVEEQRRIVARFPEEYMHVAWQVRMTMNLVRLLDGAADRSEAIELLQASDAALEPFAAGETPLPAAVETRSDVRRRLAELETLQKSSPKTDAAP